MEPKEGLSAEYSLVERWEYDSIVRDLSAEGWKKIRSGQLNKMGEFYLLYDNSCIIDIEYSRSNRLSLKVFGEEKRSKEVFNSLDKRIMRLQRGI